LSALPLVLGPAKIQDGADEKDTDTTDTLKDVAMFNSDEFV
jgi:hypothetical protein